jgi:hypothetical protein
MKSYVLRIKYPFSSTFPFPRRQADGLFLKQPFTRFLVMFLLVNSFGLTVCEHMRGF